MVEPKIQASDVVVGNRTLEAVLMELAEQSKVHAERAADAHRISAEAQRVSAEADKKAAAALETIAALMKDLRATTEEMRVANREMREFNQKIDARVSVLEAKAAKA